MRVVHNKGSNSYQQVAMKDVHSHKHLEWFWAFVKKPYFTLNNNRVGIVI
jgi:hypothetical protein